LLTDCRTLLLAILAGPSPDPADPPSPPGTPPQDWHALQGHARRLLLPTTFPDYAVGILLSAPSPGCWAMQAGGLQAVAILDVILRHQLKLVRPLRLVGAALREEMRVASRAPSAAPSISSLAGSNEGAGAGEGEGAALLGVESERAAFLARVRDVDAGAAGELAALFALAP
jgi:hypothetical protein